MHEPLVSFQWPLKGMLHLPPDFRGICANIAHCRADMQFGRFGKQLAWRILGLDYDIFGKVERSNGQSQFRKGWKRSTAVIRACSLTPQ